MPNLQINSIEIILEDVEDQTDNTIITYKENQWNINGPIYPRHIRLIDILSEFVLSGRVKEK